MGGSGFINRGNQIPQDIKGGEPTNDVWVRLGPF